MEEFCTELQGAYVALFSYNSPTIVQVKLLAERGSLVAMKLVRSLTLQLKKAGASLLTPLHISGEENFMTNIPSRQFGSNLAWFCKNDTNLLNLFNKNFPLPNHSSWTILRPSNAASMKVISVLRMHHFEMGEWLQLTKAREMLEKMVFICRTFRSGASATGCHVPEASSVTHRLRSLRTLGPLWSRKKSCNWHSLWGALSSWHDGRFGL